MKSLVVHEVRFLLVGGYAVNAFGFSRNTADLDIWIAAGETNESRVMEAIRAFGFVNAPADALAAPDAMLRMGVPPLRIEVLKRISGVEFDECFGRCVRFRAGDLEVPMISLEDLKRNKLAAGKASGFIGRPGVGSSVDSPRPKRSTSSRR